MSRSGRRLSVAAMVAVTAVLASTLPTPSAATTPGRDPLARAANANKMSVAKLEKLLRDPAAKLDADGRLFYADRPPVESVTSTEVARASAPLSQTFLLHSKPGSQHTIYLDFNGALVSGTGWNTNGLPVATYPGWDPANNGSTFSESERRKVQEVWARVAEDFAPFDVDVTTEDPGVGAIDRTGAEDLTYGTRVLLTESSIAAGSVCDGCAGAAYNGVFDTVDRHARWQPAWIFPGRLTTTKSVAEAASHEVGHQFGLTHDGPGYEPGHGSWAPIMGSSYSRPISQWSRGDYGGADNRQDDVTIIASNGAPLRTDEAGASVATAAALRQGTLYITSAADRDVFTLGECTGGLMSVSAQPAAVGPNLDIRLRLFNANGSVIAEDNPLSAVVSALLATGLGASIARLVPPGRYFVEVDGVGRGTPTAAYDDYGSIGAYTLRAPGCSPATKPSAARIGKASSGRSGGTSTARIAWQAPATDGGSAIAGYKIFVYRKRDGSFRSAGTTVVPASRRASTLNLSPGTYTFKVRSRNAAGYGPMSARSRPAVAR
jgi:hypothetical protein